MRILDFFNKQTKITSIYGVPIRFENWWIIIASLLILVSSKSIPNIVVNDFLASFVLGIATTLLLIISLIVHEYAHIKAAFSTGYEIIDTVIYPFGGIARFRRSPDKQDAEFRIAIVGPVASFLLAAFFLTLVFVAPIIDLGFLSSVFYQLFFLNIIVTVLNLFPVFPLDGGRVFRAFLRKRGYEMNQATTITANYGKVVAVILMVFALFMLLIRSDLFSGFWLMTVGVYLFFCTRKIVSEVVDFEKLLVWEVMTVPVFVEPNSTIARFQEKIVPLFQQNIFLVAHDKQFYGVLVLDDIKQVPRDDWYQIKIHKVMRPITPDYFVETTANVNDAREIMRGNGIGALGVIDEKGNLVGFMQRGKIRKRT
jgi:Zn-dependent protease/CBS domain-containing protein